jgi:hypothetical protein
MTDHYWWCGEGDDCECDPDVTEEEATLGQAMRERGLPTTRMAAGYVPPIFSGDRGALDTPPCFSLPPADPERFSRGDHDA